ncbi:oligoendopeptidase F, partial [Bacillus pseudomycoides]
MSNQKTAKTLPDRSEIEEMNTWRLEDVFQTDEEWEKEFQAVKELLPKLTEFKGKLGDSADSLLEALQYEDEVSMRLGKLYTYAHMRYDQDTTNSAYQALNDRATNLYSQASSSMAYIVPEILTISEEQLQSFLQENKELSVYEHALEEITRQRPHVLSEAEEALLAEASEVMSASSSTFGMLNNADLKFPSIKDENGEEV